ncbi:hypothetical protein PR048_032617 [Dryococelus australis]|uniref:Uncharacterized protein n=1 Tax=Dryococelus australis TaxID=614101 RepID=A0ABQ9G5K0_9NEOP|nr:hypothetical protein PR048_032617 [Dryococelus australis]
MAAVIVVLVAVVVVAAVMAVPVMVLAVVVVAVVMVDVVVVAVVAKVLVVAVVARPVMVVAVVVVALVMVMADVVARQGRKAKSAALKCKIHDREVHCNCMNVSSDKSHLLRAITPHVLFLTPENRIYPQLNGSKGNTGNQKMLDEVELRAERFDRRLTAKSYGCRLVRHTDAESSLKRERKQDETPHTVHKREDRIAATHNQYAKDLIRHDVTLANLRHSTAIGYSRKSSPCPADSTPHPTSALIGRYLISLGRFRDTPALAHSERQAKKPLNISLTCVSGYVFLISPKMVGNGTKRTIIPCLPYARLQHRSSKLDPRSDLRSTQKTVAPFEFRAGLEIEMKFISNRQNWRFEISIRDQQPSSTKKIQNHEISSVQHFYIETKIKLDPGSELGSSDLESGKIAHFIENSLYHTARTFRPSNKGGVVVRLLTSRLGEPDSIPGGAALGFLHVGIVPDDAAGRRIFSEISRFPRLFIPALLYSTAHTIQKIKTSPHAAELGYGWQHYHRD